MAVQHFARFEDLDDEHFFAKFVTEYLHQGWKQAVDRSGSRIEIDPERVALASNTYQLTIQKYVVALSSANPDHYKRSGALLHALYDAAPITNVTWDENAEYMRNFENLGVSYADAEHWDNYMSWFENYRNDAMAFDLAFRCCQMYEPHVRDYNKDFLDNICYYMAENRQLSASSFMMILKAFHA